MQAKLNQIKVYEAELKFGSDILGALEYHKMTCSSRVEMVGIGWNWWGTHSNPSMTSDR
jgi:hypothetical protein